MQWYLASRDRAEALFQLAFRVVHLLAQLTAFGMSGRKPLFRFQKEFPLKFCVIFDFSSRGSVSGTSNIPISIILTYGSLVFTSTSHLSGKT